MGCFFCSCAIACSRAWPPRISLSATRSRSPLFASARPATALVARAIALLSFACFSSRLISATRRYVIFFLLAAFFFSATTVFFFSVTVAFFSTATAFFAAAASATKRLARTFFTCVIRDAAGVVLSGSGAGVAVAGSDAEVVVDGSGAGVASLAPYIHLVLSAQPLSL
ncbi:hypothetical protein GN958_ATG12460 [Phytophthora infestans]|uniref:Transmembrane protein n=1 Tax=Phytophthora infestans TaxID=4787 RepID=A0A8S9UCC7_PHYIN|nr:hypothetical protein GN958_ATG12460 [Phytophthora infestans]